MKIKFTKLPTIGGKIQVSLDGGQSFTDYNIEDIHDSGIPLDDNQDYEKIQIQGPANLLKNLNVVKQIKLEGSDGSSSGAGLSIKKTYWGWADDATGPANCYTDGSSRGAKVYRYENGQMIDTGRTVIGMGGGGGSTGLMISDSGSVGYVKSNKRHYSNLDVTVEVESITEIQEAPTFTENGTFTAEEGKAFKNVLVNVNSWVKEVSAEDTVQVGKLYVHTFIALAKSGDVFEYEIFNFSNNTYQFPLTGHRMWSRPIGTSGKFKDLSESMEPNYNHRFFELIPQND